MMENAMLWEWLLAYLALGAVVGFFAGLLGVGGGGIMVPVLTSMFLAQGLGDQSVHLALATSMASIVLTSVSSIRSHQRHGAILWPVVWRLSPAIVAGTIGAALIAGALPSTALAVFFCCFMSYVALQMLLNVKPKASRQLPGWGGLSLTGLSIGGISALVAIGGGSLTVPFLTWCNVRVQNAIATSAAVGLPIALSGTVGYLWSGWAVESTPQYSSGYVYWPAVVCISLVSFFTAPLGVKLAHRLPVSTLKKIFAALLVLLSAKMLHSVLVAL
ncbi:sulfite exporter TauE/SafE family protein [Rheinheimera marina]